MKVVLGLIFILVNSLVKSSNEFTISEGKNVVIFGSNKPGVYLFRSADSHSYLDSEFTDAFYSLKETLNVEFVISDMKEKIEKSTASVLKVMPKDLPVIKLYDTSVDEVKEFTMTEEINKNNIINFIKRCLNGESIRQDL
jgi:hypothetical protein